MGFCQLRPDLKGTYLLNQISHPNLHTRTATKLSCWLPQESNGSDALFGPETVFPAATRGRAGSVAGGVHHPDTSHLVQALHILGLKINPLFRQGQTIKITIVRLSEVEDDR